MMDKDKLCPMSFNSMQRRDCGDRCAWWVDDKNGFKGCGIMYHMGSTVEQISHVVHHLPMIG